MKINNYTELCFDEIRTLPTPVLPEALEMLRSLKKKPRKKTMRKVLKNTVHKTVRKTAKESPSMKRLLALAGSWEDTRSAEEIIADIRRNRRSNMNRRMSLDG